MKKLILPVLSLFMVLTIGFGSCKKETDKCADRVCLYGGECVDGTCKCPDGFSGDSCQISPACDPGYEGVFCDIKSRDKFINGSYEPTWACTAGVSLHSKDRVYITAESDITKVRISRLYNQIGVLCTINGQFLTIDQSLNPDTTITGYGYCEGANKSVSISYVVSAAGGLVDSCKVVLVHP